MQKFYLDPRTKLVICMCLSILAMIFNQPDQLLLLLIFTIIFTGIFGVDLLKTINRFRMFLPLFLMLLVVQSVFSPSGSVLFMVGHVPILTTGGMAMGFSVLIRMLIVLYSALFLITGTSRDLVLGLIQWKVPYEIAFMANLGLSFIPLLREEIRDALIAVQLRGREIKIKNSSIRKSLSLISTIFFPVVYGVLVKAQKLTIAMEARGFRAYKTRTYLRKLTLQRQDYFFMGLFIFGALTLIAGKFIR